MSNKNYNEFNTTMSIYIDNVKIKVYKYLLDLKGFKENEFYDNNLSSVVLRNEYVIDKKRYNRFTSFSDFMNKLENTNYYLEKNYLLYNEIEYIFTDSYDIYNKLSSYYGDLDLIINHHFYKNDNNKVMNKLKYKLNILKNILDTVGNKTDREYYKYFNKKIINVDEFI
jgi:hypothetical protein